MLTSNKQKKPIATTVTRECNKVLQFSGNFLRKLTALQLVRKESLSSVSSSTSTPFTSPNPSPALNPLRYEDNTSTPITSPNFVPSIEKDSTTLLPVVEKMAVLSLDACNDNAELINCKVVDSAYTKRSRDQVLWHFDLNDAELMAKFSREKKTVTLATDVPTTMQAAHKLIF